jgi:hypothetical protein
VLWPLPAEHGLLVGSKLGMVARYRVRKEPPGGKRKRVWMRKFLPIFELTVGVGISEFPARKCSCPV